MNLLNIQAISLTIITIAFLWLMTESKWLTVKLYYGKVSKAFNKTGDQIIQELLPLVTTIGILIYVIKMFKLKEDNDNDERYIALRQLYQELNCPNTVTRWI